MGISHRPLVSSLEFLSQVGKIHQVLNRFLTDLIFKSFPLIAACKDRRIANDVIKTFIFEV